ncbi:juvenile hormone esterase-like [Adelges cooleyi]|uniref:juvenile hormone esterase-like n=1 Tax=Adelges cooleyi TaxID=133065 RepID=UPI00217F5081|nr:juvenile hormone esterase-like [Adelges cooleyi]XP_050427117.1 juvenile hormone esterase-like [Adelges cooleyi]XP_050427118.1 juvenile hormone esterase-like [Adelges cooleyi]XP_050427119.1 juvenile hormone esterase-like [Adelges cooleyi]
MIINIEQGAIQGQYYKTRPSNKPFVSFLGIPYAKPPVGELRFKPPVKHPGWTGVYKAFSKKEKCVQLDPASMEKVFGSEDCLYLNIFVPQEINEKKPVMIFVHGGVFNLDSGSSNLYSPDYLIEENVILVTFNYRLNVLGFLNLDIDDCPGNMGLKDQLLAFKWVKENIAAFGGDANNITVFGISAGSVSIHCHILSPLSKGVFQRAIMQSGCAFNPWTINLKHKNAALKLAADLGCPSDEPHEIVQYLRRVPLNDLVKATKVESISKDQREFLVFQFIPTIESDQVSERLIPAHPQELSKTATSIPLISGLTDLEGMVFFGDHRIGKLIPLRNVEEFIEFFKGDVKSDEVKKRIRSFYFNGHDLKTDIENLESICKITGDVFFTRDFHKGFVHLLEKGNTPVYNYEFKFDGEINLLKEIFFSKKPNLRKLKGACHGDELSYLFLANSFAFTPKPNSRELRMCRTICKLWTNFAKTGNPNSSDLKFKWDCTSLENPKHLSIDGDDTHMVEGEVNGARVKFWKDIAELVKLNQKL